MFFLIILALVLVIIAVDAVFFPPLNVQEPRIKSEKNVSKSKNAQEYFNKYIKK